MREIGEDQEVGVGHSTGTPGFRGGIGDVGTEDGEDLVRKSRVGEEVGAMGGAVCAGVNG